MSTARFVGESSQRCVSCVLHAVRAVLARLPAVRTRMLTKLAPAQLP